jgi:hypothetical protein
MMRYGTTLLAALLLAAAGGLGSGAAASQQKVQVCHRPPGNPNNYHTITIGAPALPAHLAHGDLAGACLDQCAALCDDGDLCTTDSGIPNTEAERCECSHSSVDCNDGNVCTADSCDPASGCENVPRPGATCDDGQVCTGPDACTPSGQCAGTPILGCCDENADCTAPDLCTVATCNLATHTCAGQQKVCTPPDQCTVSACNPTTGDCESTPVICPADPCNTAACNPTNGTCGQTPISGCCTSDAQCGSFELCVSGSCQPQVGCCRSDIVPVCGTATFALCEASEAALPGFPTTFVPGAVCNGATGTCGPVDMPGGECCQTALPLSPTQNLCYEGAVLDPVGCANFGGTLHPGQSCTPQGCQ